MSAVDPLSIRYKVEAALLGYLLARRAALSGNALLAPKEVTFTRRVEVTSKVLPRVVTATTRDAAREEAEQLYDVEFVLYVGASAYEGRDNAYPEADIAALHAARVGLLTEWMADKSAILAALNAPEAPTPDTRVVKGIKFYDVWCDDHSGDQVDNHFMDQLTYTVVAQLQDEP